MNGQRVIGITFIAILMLIAIVLLIQAGRFILGGSSDDTDTADETVVVERVITDYIDSEAIATFTHNGEIVNDEDHNKIEIEITPSKRELRIINGYGNVVETRKSFKNTEQAYEAFMSALAFEGILEQKEAVYASPDGVCPTGNRFEYSLNVDGNDEDLNTWASSCSRRHGSFDGDRRGVQKLFEAQIPEFNDLTSEVSL